MGETLTARLVGGAGGTVTRVTEITMTTENWYGGEGVWAQIVEVEEVSPFTKIDLQPSAEQVLLLQKLETALTAENEEGVVTVYATGNRPETDITIQATCTEVVRERQGTKVHGNTVGWAVPLIYPKKV